MRPGSDSALARRIGDTVGCEVGRPLSSPRMRVIGQVVRLQVQRASLKVPAGPGERYDPTPLIAVESVEVTPDGAVGLGPDGESIVDVHHRRHPGSKNSGKNPLSVGFTSHYAAIRERFGQVPDGIAGENILIETDLEFREGGPPPVLLIGDARIGSIVVAEPCLPFTRFLIGAPPEAPADADSRAALAFLRHGTRGFYGSVVAEAIVRMGDSVRVI